MSKARAILLKNTKYVNKKTASLPTRLKKLSTSRATRVVYTHKDVYTFLILMTYIILLHTCCLRLLPEPPPLGDFPTPLSGFTPGLGEPANLNGEKTKHGVNLTGPANAGTVIGWPLCVAAQLNLHCQLGWHQGRTTITYACHHTRSASSCISPMLLLVTSDPHHASLGAAAKSLCQDYS